MDAYNIYLLVAETCAQKGITPQEACVELNVDFKMFQEGSLLAHNKRTSKSKQKKPKNPRSIANKKYDGKIQDEIKEKYLKASQWLIKNPKLKSKDACEKFGISPTSFFKARRILGDNEPKPDVKKREYKKRDIKEAKKIMKKEPQKKWQTWQFTEDTAQKCKQAIAKQEEDPSLSNGDITEMFGISKASYYAYRRSLGLISNRMPVKKTKQLATTRVQTIRYIPEEKEQIIDVNPVKTNSKKQGMVVVGDVDFLTEFARKLREN